MSGDWRDVRIYAEKPYSISFESSAFRHLISDLGANAEMSDRFENWKFPEIEEGKPTKYNWVVQHKENFRLGYQTDIGAFTYINAKFGVTIEDEVQIGSHCSIYSVSTIDDKVGESSVICSPSSALMIKHLFHFLYIQNHPNSILDLPQSIRIGNLA